MAPVPSVLSMNAQAHSREARPHEVGTYAGSCDCTQHWDVTPGKGVDWRDSHVSEPRDHRDMERIIAILLGVVLTGMAVSRMMSDA